MRTAEEIIVNYDGESFQGLVFSETAWTYKECIEMINEARKEAIEECAERAYTERYTILRANDSQRVDKQSILSLINELK